MTNQSETTQRLKPEHLAAIEARIQAVANLENSEDSLAFSQAIDEQIEHTDDDLIALVAEVKRLRAIEERILPDKIAQMIREADGGHTAGAGAIGESIVSGLLGQRERQQ